MYSNSIKRLHLCRGKVLKHHITEIVFNLVNVSIRAFLLSFSKEPLIGQCLLRPKQADII